ncbi:hypothetical protein CRYUN_Cryun17cG0139000 [Craigia yunnanensis]
MVKHITMETTQELYYAVTPKRLGIADLGCSSGPNSLSFIEDIVDSVEGTSHKNFHPIPEFRVYLDDLPTNNFNSVFKSLPDFYRDLKKDRNDGGPDILIAGYPGSFNGKLFPNNCLHFIYSSYSLHWLSKVPPALYNKHGKSINKGKVYISESSPPKAGELYSFYWEEYGRSCISVSQDPIPYRFLRLEMFEIEREVKGGESYGTAGAMTVRAIQESMLSNHFGDRIDLDTLFNNYGKMVDEEMAQEEFKPITFVVVLKKL